MTIALEWSAAHLDADLVVEDKHIKTDTGLESAVIISLHTDERVGHTEEHPGAVGDRRGWWGDQFLKLPLGSKVWTLTREKLTPKILPKLVAEVTAALVWLKAAGLAAKIEATAEIYDSKTAAVKILITKPGAAGETWERVWRVYFGLE